MKINFPLKQHIEKNLIIYLAILIVIPVLTCYSIYAKNLAKDFEKYTIVCGAKITDKNTMQSIVYSNGSIKECSIYAREYNDNFFDYMQSPLTYADLIILPDVKGAINDSALSSYVSLNEPDEFYDETNYQKDNIHYGIQINKYHKLDEQFEYLKDTNYYIFMRKNSLHVNRWNSSSVTNISYNVLKEYLL